MPSEKDFTIKPHVILRHTLSSLVVGRATVELTSFKTILITKYFIKLLNVHMYHGYLMQSLILNNYRHTRN